MEVPDYHGSGENIYKQQRTGLTPFYNGLIVQQIVKYISDNEKINSGYRKNVFVRWDLLCQMFNHLAANKIGIYEDDEDPIHVLLLSCCGTV